MNLIAILFVLLLMIAIIIPTSAQTARYRMITLDTSLGGGKRYKLLDINEKGQVLALDRVMQKSVIWDLDFGLRDISTLHPRIQSVLRINNSGAVVGVTSDDTVFAWSLEMGMQELTLSNICPEDINDSGKVIVYTPAFTGVSAVWDPASGGLRNIPLLEGMNGCYLRGLNNRGQVIGVMVNYSALDLHKTSFIWDIEHGTQATPIAWVVAINDRGHALGRVDNPDGSFTNCIWDSVNDRIECQLPDDDTDIFYYTHLNNRDQVVGARQNPDMAETALLWENGTVYDLNTITKDTHHWTLKRAEKITDSGYILAEAHYANQFSTPAILAPV